MRNLWTQCGEIKPLAVYTYFDVVRCWLKKSLTRQELAFLDNHCGGGINAENRPARSDWPYRQRLTLYRPSDEALLFLLTCDNLLLNYVEITAELLMTDETAVRQLLDLFDTNFLQPWHRKHSSSIPMAPQPALLPNRPNAEAVAGFSGTETGPAKSQVKYPAFGSN